MANNLLEILEKNHGNLLLIQKKLINMLREYFSLRMQSKMGQLKQLHLLRQSRRNIASFKSNLSNNKKHL